jgi:hypothetical protein
MRCVGFGALVDVVRVRLEEGVPWTTRELAMFITEAVLTVEPTGAAAAAAHVTTLAATAIQRLALDDDHVTLS